MYDEGRLFIGCMMVAEGAKNPLERLSDGITVETRGAGCVIRSVKQCEGESMYACVDCLLYGGETGSGVER